MQTKSQRYSKLVFDAVGPWVKKETDKKQDAGILRKYKSLCKRSGGMIRTVGLVQYLSFLMAKGKKESERHHALLLEHLTNELEKLAYITPTEDTDLLEAVRRQNLTDYMHTTTEVLHLLSWHKQISDILIAGEE